ncbi:MAG: poly-gamma-glutamate system protein [Candidatus Marinimicrobia bacterium]|jgi:poly-gamma-glutamate system protein|nr:poly-gamma-glutamate system protein [Candidatus Neomarinimicrobiota bacterium]MBT3634084.1 poly-gamma-glutamate system protein [Candidatus Neomarinimicrobiota bacterium]MBT3683042.1 poly-gamma-glutamate system protein [Candidatus Neomarinimicrobiota bacterium]MBT3759866.1 poly-gamma-glutamate system protein [Candidatus Neomarinimicrobiota bacterium]MBT3895681.1 poly-gamma-glutamate system protein [Candidatus Neomarinimicrobiota bacterium]
MFRPVIQKTRVLAGLALFNLIVFYVAINSQVNEKSRGYEIKIEAAGYMQDAMIALKDYRLGDSGVFVDSENDPNETTLIGSQYGPTTTDEGDLDAKLTTLNPNFAALIIDMMIEAGVEYGDAVAVSLTGSMPGANIATFAAGKALNLDLHIITSVGASQWGANDPYYTWLDMETILNEREVFDFKSEAASIGGKGDNGKGVSIFGRELLWESIYRNNVTLIQEDSLVLSIDRRLDIYSEDLPLNNYSALINIGGGAASIGPSINSRLIPSAVSFPGDLLELSGRSIVRDFSRNNIPIIQILDIHDLADTYALPWAPIPTPVIGEGIIFSQLKYNFWITLLCLILAIASVTAVGIYSHKQIKERMANYEPESIL